MEDLRTREYHSPTYFVSPKEAARRVIADYEDEAERLGEAVLIDGTISLKEFKIKINELTRRTNHMLEMIRQGATRRSTAAPHNPGVIAPPPAPVRRENGKGV